MKMGTKYMCILTTASTVDYMYLHHESRGTNALHVGEFGVRNSHRPEQEEVDVLSTRRHEEMNGAIKPVHSEGARVHCD